MPSNFAWFVQDKVAGMERPGSCHPLGEDLGFLRERGIEIIISLTVPPLGGRELEDFDFERFHIPIPDGAAPGLAEIDRFVGYVSYGLRSGRRVVVHCGAGYGRTGTMVACWLVSTGRSAAEAIAEVRRAVPPAIENAAQEARVAEYETYLRGKGRAAAHKGA